MGWPDNGLVILVGLIFLIFLCIESSITGKDKVKWHFWFQLFTGNWSSVPDEYNTRPLMTSLSMLLAFVLNLASFGLFGLIANQLAILRKVQAMKLVDMLRKETARLRTAF